MAVSDEEIAHARDLFAGLGDIDTRKMFGGVGIYHRGTIFAVLMSDGALLIKGAGDMIAVFEQRGMARWTYQRPGKAPTSMPYWHVPDSLRDDPEAATHLARAALAHL